MGRPRQHQSQDLADMVALINSGLDPARAMNAARHVFAVRNTHPLPDKLPDPQLFWNEDYPAFADELGLTETSVDQAMLTLREFWARARETEK